MSVTSCMINLAGKKLAILNYLSPLMNLTVRFWLAWQFWVSGILKLPAGFLGIGKGNWDTTLYLFRQEHPVPLLNPEFAAYVGTAFEVICPVLLVFGVGSRIAAFILIVMTAFIELTYQHSVSHIHWMMLSGIILFYGPDRLSIDWYIRRNTLGTK